MFVDCSVGDVSTVHGRYKVTNNWGWAAWQFLLGFPFWRSSFTQPQEAAALAGFDKQPHLWPGTFGRSPGLTEVGSIWQCAPWRRWDGGWLVDWHSLVFSILLSWQLCLSGGEICWNCQLLRAHDGAGHWGFLSLISSYLCQVYGLPTLIELELRRGHNVS